MNIDTYIRVKWITLGDSPDDPEADIAAVAGSNEVFVDASIAGPPSDVSRFAARDGKPILHRRRERYLPAAWVTARYPEARDRVAWIVQEALSLANGEQVEARHDG